MKYNDHKKEPEDKIMQITKVEHGVSKELRAGRNDML